MRRAEAVPGVVVEPGRLCGISYDARVGKGRVKTPWRRAGARLCRAVDGDKKRFVFLNLFSDFYRKNPLIFYGKFPLNIYPVQGSST
ncbi:hypothetical protein [Pseudomonas abieticivorans]|uniref:hypothetical protein n=1 Tax=Pseudomonas abieticivorans TaxID=2931382 RepID=UPI0020BFC298|nr:hypothetical protein [Pseudomonas sp. PIA16]